MLEWIWIFITIAPFWMCPLSYWTRRFEKTEFFTILECLDRICVFCKRVWGKIHISPTLAFTVLLLDLFIMFRKDRRLKWLYACTCASVCLCVQAYIDIYMCLCEPQLEVVNRHNSHNVSHSCQRLSLQNTSLQKEQRLFRLNGSFYPTQILFCFFFSSSDIMVEKLKM